MRIHENTLEYMRIHGACLGSGLAVRATLRRLRQVEVRPPHRTQPYRGRLVTGRVDVEQVGVGEHGVEVLVVRFRRVGGGPAPLLEQALGDVAQPFFLETNTLLGEKTKNQREGINTPNCPAKKL